MVSAGDFLFFRIENEYVLSLMILYAISCVCGISGGNFFFALQVAGATFIVTFILNRFDLIGGGDVKLLFPMILLSENNMSDFWLGTSVSGLALALIYLFWGPRILSVRKKITKHLALFSKKRNKFNFLNIALLSLSRIDKRAVGLNPRGFNAMKQEIPYGIAISCGGFYVVFESFTTG
jgi:Flp pilus assembly protein protease CpaA